MAAAYKSDSFLVVHPHPGEGSPDVQRRRFGVRDVVWPLRVDVNQTHVGRGEGFLEFIGTVIDVSAAVISSILALRDPGRFRAPVNTLVRLPSVDTPAGEAKSWESHLLQSHIARQHDQVSPGDAFAVLLLDGPKQSSWLVQILVVRPAVERRKTLLSLRGGDVNRRDPRVHKAS